MSGGIEKQTRKALRRMVFWRILGEFMVVPQGVFGALQFLCVQIMTWLKSVEMAIFYLEQDAARKYQLLTGVDLASASGAPARYGLLVHPDLGEDVQRRFLEAGAEDDDD